MRSCACTRNLKNRAALNRNKIDFLYFFAFLSATSQIFFITIFPSCAKKQSTKFNAAINYVVWRMEWKKFFSLLCFAAKERKVSVKLWIIIHIYISSKSLKKRTNEICHKKLILFKLESFGNEKICSLYT